MKTKILGTTEEIELPKVFESSIREDIVKKVHDSMFNKQRYSTYILAGKSSSPHKQSHARRKFKTLYGKGISRVARKALWRRGDQFYWVGTFTPGTVKGRAAHPPKIKRRERLINKKEKILALKSCLAATASEKILKENYPNLAKLSFPIVINSDVLGKKSKEIFKFFKENKINLEQKKKIRPGIGKVRGRKYKNTRKIILILGQEENIRNIRNINLKFSSIAHLNIKEISLNGRPGKLAVYTEKAIKDLKNKFG